MPSAAQGITALARRTVLAGAATGLLARPAIAQAAPLRLGLMLPYSGTYAALGENITWALKMFLAGQGGKLGGRAVTLVKLDDESDPAKAPANVNRLIGRDRVDVLMGTVHSGVVMALVQAARERELPLIIPNAGNAAATRELCAPTIFRTSFTNWQPAYGMGLVLGRQGVKKAAFVTWDYAAGREAAEGFRDGLRASGGELTQVLTVPFPDTNFQPLLAQLPGLGVATVGAFFSGGGAVQFVRDYAAAGLREKLPLCGPGFLTEGTLAGQGAAAEGMRTALHYADGLDNARNNEFRPAFRAKAGREADVFAVHGYDAGQLLAVGLAATQGDAAALQPMCAAMAGATIDSPRGKFKLSPQHNPVQTIYLREVKQGQNRLIGIAAPDLADPGTGCRMTS